MEPWDGPASVAFTDGTMMGATLDRNGLRPSRYYVTHDDLVIMGSEAGVLPVDPANVKLKGRLQPGKMFIVNMEEGRIVPDDEIKEKIAAEKPYREWLDKNLVKLADIKAEGAPAPLPDHETMLKRQQAFGYTFEDLRMLMTPMARDGVEAIGSMGTDIPFAVLSNKAKLLYDYFKQLFAQVTNPPIDCIREEIVTSPITTIGREGNLLDPQPESCHLIELKTPILSNEELAKLKSHRQKANSSPRRIDITLRSEIGRKRHGKGDGRKSAPRQTNSSPRAGTSSFSDRGVVPRRRRHSGACSLWAVCTITSSAKAPAPSAISCWSPASRVKCTTSARSSVTAAERSILTSPLKRSTT
jgi:glutamate synthase (ferredoxin)